MAKKLTDLPEWHALEAHFSAVKYNKMNDYFSDDEGRFERFSLEAAGVFLDYSKNRIMPETMDLLGNLARAVGVEKARDAMFSGEKINESEGREVLHVALRAAKETQIEVEGKDVVADVHKTLAAMKRCVMDVREGIWRGYTGKILKNIVHIGIGGSHLGPQMVVEAMASYAKKGLDFYFVSNVDGHNLAAVFEKIDAEETLFLIASKTFTTAETMLNAASARAWLVAKLEDEAAVSQHFIALSSNVEGAKEFGIEEGNIFGFWDWVGGRYSIWSAIGLPLMMAIGAEGFEGFLRGARDMDRHFCDAPIGKNMPIIMGLLGVWYRNFYGFSTHAILPYDHRLGRLPAFLQQLDMESNGKHVTKAGAEVDVSTGAVVFGGAGTDAQHSFFQLLHQGVDIIPADFIAIVTPNHKLENHHNMLLANCLAQAEALMVGCDMGEIRGGYGGDSGALDDVLGAQRCFEGNRPTSMILLEKLEPYSLGALIALYEHKVFVEGHIWGINSFDQWGVELGKKCAKVIENELQEDGKSLHDASTTALIRKIKGLTC